MEKYCVIAGLGILIVGLFIIFVPYVETFRQESVQTSVEVGGNHHFEPFSARRHDWLDLDILASEDVNVFVKGQIQKTIFNLRGQLFQYSVHFEDFDAYRVEIYAPEYASGAVNVTGSIYVRRVPEYFYSLWLGNLVRVNGVGVPIVLLGLAITVFCVLRVQAAKKSD